ncbi:hypothetical protein AArc1_3174 [Natrarchaeobaculum sulfurireducens]|uniref:Uncharacterized protein n=1 Tax=Natrarchaeobaculum sulfurireducens TaxID=2044521 RepID=A0A346PIY4_9EURY|nr:hypothetical protein AArc1_3174 [Natrarchaeobaculum sulfurireducens]
MPTEFSSPDATLGSLTCLGTDAVAVTDLQERLERATVPLPPTLSSLIDNDRVRHPEASDVGR